VVLPHVSAAATEAVRLRLRTTTSPEPPQAQKFIDPFALGKVDWRELQWLARVAMLNILPEENTQKMFDAGTGRVIEVPEAHQRIVFGIDSNRGVQVPISIVLRSHLSHVRMNCPVAASIYL
jgi:hypothetical protein